MNSQSGLFEIRSQRNAWIYGDFASAMNDFASTFLDQKSELRVGPARSSERLAQTSKEDWR
jgi:hypothetical protein